jgi:hypothetical protein
LLYWKLWGPIATGSWYYGVEIVEIDSANKPDWYPNQPIRVKFLHSQSSEILIESDIINEYVEKYETSISRILLEQNMRK